jgi:hypothetical protein
VAYKPGSFTKNFAWQGSGLAKLHTAIKSGFSSQLTPVTREAFRAHCGVPQKDLQLIPINFFLFNALHQQKLHLEIDELVFQAIEQPHSLVFDRLALFALNLSQVGGLKAGGADWAREFVQERLWVNGYWKRAMLSKERLEEFLRERLDARPEVRNKCITNYRHLYELAGYFDDREEYIENRDGTWLCSAIILAWDRAILAGRLPKDATEAQLGKYADDAAIHNLLGVPKEFGERLARSLAGSYADYEGTRRFAARPAVSPGAAQGRVSGERTSSALELEEIASEVTASQVARKKREVEQQIRNKALAAALKRHYRSECMFCPSRVVVSISPEQLYAEAIHIRPLGRPHNGPDRPENMLVLCPNCHVQFDAGTICISVGENDEMRLTSKAKEHALEGKVVVTRGGHTVGKEYVIWHRDYWMNRRR